MKKELVITGIIGMVIGGIIAGAAASYAVNNNNVQMMSGFGMDTPPASQTAHNHAGGKAMDDMTKELKSKTADEFDKAFLRLMREHHQGAIDMANLAATRAKHDEIKNLSAAIITAQKKEIDDMHAWEHDWGYAASHSAPQAAPATEHGH